MSTEIAVDKQQPGAAGLQESTATHSEQDVSVALLTGGGDRSYVFGLTKELLLKGVTLDLIGSDELDCPEFHGVPRLTFLNLRGDQNPNASLPRKVLRIVSYYSKLIRYAATAKPRIFHILWNNKFEHFDRTLVLCYYRILGKKVVLTVHNVNAGKRDQNDTALNRLTLRIQYRLADHLFVHTEKMKQDLISEFGVRTEHISVIPLGINNAVPCTDLTCSQARKRLGIRDEEKAMLFFGRITPYKGLEYLVTAFQKCLEPAGPYRLIIAGRPEERTEAEYWVPLGQALREDVLRGRVLLRAEHVPDEETEVYFKAADVLVLPYRDIYQSGILFLGYSFGLPALVSNVGSLKDEIIEGSTGFVFRTEDPADLAKAIEKYFASDVYRNLSGRRKEIQEYARKGHGWNDVGQITMRVYNQLLSHPA